MRHDLVRLIDDDKRSALELLMAFKAHFAHNITWNTAIDKRVDSDEANAVSYGVSKCRLRARLARSLWVFVCCKFFYDVHVST